MASDPPPYTNEQIQNMRTPGEKVRAFAELSSYIMRKKREVEEQVAHHPHEHSSHAGASNGYEHRSAGPNRRGYSHSRGGAYGYHPYQRPTTAYNTPSFRNQSVTFNNQGLSDETAEGNGAGGPRVQHSTAPQNLCRAFTSSGICSRRGCRYVHDPNQQAACQHWLYKDNCLNGDSCPLMHESTPYNTPFCKHFQKGRCTTEPCRFLHVRLNPAAPNCEAFGLTGYCAKGADCSALHVHECPTFANTGNCFYGDKCRLGHIRRASRMRKATRNSSEGLSSPESTPKEDLDDSADSETLIGKSAERPEFPEADYLALNARG